MNKEVEVLREMVIAVAMESTDVELLDLPKHGSLPVGFDERIKMVPLDKRARLWNLSGEDVKKAGLWGKIKYSVIGVFKKI